MHPKALAHLSDLHLGRSPATERAARRLCEELLSRDIDHVVVTGDLTHRGRCADLELFFEIFDPLLQRGRLTFIPGNHDRNGEDCGAELMHGKRVDVADREGLRIVRANTTADHNQSVIASHGELTHEMVADIERAVDTAPDGAFVVVLLHHHLLPLPVEGIGEWLAEQVGWPNAEELGLGRDLITRLLGRCDLILHGHRHIPREVRYASHRRTLGVYNAGSSTEMGRVRLFSHEAGRPVGKPMWLAVPTTIVPETRRAPAPGRAPAAGRSTPDRTSSATARP